MPLFDTRSGKTEMVMTYYEVTELLGTGRFSEVYKAYDKYHKTEVALKVYTETDEATKNIAKEEEATLTKLAELNTNYFPKSRGIRVYNRHPVVVMELGEYIGDDGRRRIISLQDILPNVKTGKYPGQEVLEFWEEDICWGFIIDLINAVFLLHKWNIIHRDLKPTNTLLKRAPGEKRVKPFLLDFNTSTRSGDVARMGGTECYLPPEVVSGKRKEPDFADDQWALAETIWEVLFGIGQRVTTQLEVHSFLKFKPTSTMIEILRRALSMEPESRFLNVETFKNAVDEALKAKVGPVGGVFVTSDEMIWAQENRSRLFEDAIETLCGENEIAVVKETRDRVEFIYSLLTMGEVSSSFDLANEIGNLGTKAIPAMIEESYKIPSDGSVFDTVARALTSLAKRDKDLAVRSINLYCLSSDYAVRKMCLNLCEKLQVFPNRLIESVIEDSALYLPKERVDIADMCIRYSTDSSALLTLNKYMCREYILDPQSYADLRDRIARRVNDFNFNQKARLILEDTEVRIWEELPEYDSLGDPVKEEIDKGLLQLFADAFASLGEEALEITKKGLPSKCKLGKLRIASTFTARLALKYPPARAWLFKTLNLVPNYDLFHAATRLKKSLTDKERDVFQSAGRSLGIPLDMVNIREVFTRYLLDGNAKDRNSLRWDGDVEALNLVEEEMTARTDTSSLRNILSLLKSYKNTRRDRISKIICDNWERFLTASCDDTIDVLTEYGIPDENTKNRCISLLNAGLTKEWRGSAMRGIERILKHQD